MDELLLRLNDIETDGNPRPQVFLDAKCVSATASQKSAITPDEDTRILICTAAALRKWNGKGCAVVTANTYARVKEVAAYLKGCGFKVARVHKNKVKRRRELERFRRKKCGILVAYSIKSVRHLRTDVRLIVHAGLPFSFSGYTDAAEMLNCSRKRCRDVLIYSNQQFQQRLNFCDEDEEQKIKAWRKALYEGRCLHKLIDEQAYGITSAERCKDLCCHCKQHKLRKG